jgi:hypothetical protein
VRCWILFSKALKSDGFTDSAVFVSAGCVWKSGGFEKV